MGEFVPGGIDLERLASAYGHRAAGEADRRRASIAADAAGLEPGDVAIDVGGGRGGHAAVFAARGAMAVVVDRSPVMARHSAAAGIPTVVADGERLPLGAGVARLVYFHLSIHHGDAVRMIGEAARVTRSGGTVWIWTLDHSHHRASFLTRWFPSVGPIDEQRFPHPDLLAEALAEEGLTAIPTIVRRDDVVRPAVEWEAAVRSGFVSTLQLIDAEELADGLERFRSAHPDPSERIEYSLLFRCVAGRK